jgi:uridine kinase
MSKRELVLDTVGNLILQLPSNRILRVGIDGVDGAGKTTFADELAEVLRLSARPVIRASVDGFHNPKVVRYRLGRNSPRGFFHDSYDYAALKGALLDPFSRGGSNRYRVATFDLSSDAPISLAERIALPHSILIFDGIFLHRSELRDYWDFSVFLHVTFDISMSRCYQRGGGSPDPDAPENGRYVEGQRLYLRSCEPRQRATLTIDNNDLSAPFIDHVSTETRPAAPARRA